MGKVKFKTIGSGKKGTSKKDVEYIRLFLRPYDLKNIKEADLSEKIYLFKKKFAQPGEPEYSVSAPIINSLKEGEN